MFLTPFLFALMTGYIFSKEYSDRTINQLFAYAVSRTHIFIVKLLVVFTMIVMTFVIASFSVTVIGAMKVFAGEIPPDLFLRGLAMNGSACLLSFGTVPVASAAVIVGKNIVPVMVLDAFASLITTSLKIGENDLALVLVSWGTPYYMTNEFSTNRFG